MSHRDSPIKKNKELKKPMDIMNVGFVGVAGGGAEPEAVNGTLVGTTNGYTYYKFTSTSSSTFDSAGKNVQILVAGGGGGTDAHGGAGGAGGVLTTNMFTPTSGALAVVVGAKGNQGHGGMTAGTNGGNSSYDGNIAGGGGAGGMLNVNGNNSGYAGSNSGGAGGSSSTRYTAGGGGSGGLTLKSGVTGSTHGAFTGGVTVGFHTGGAGAGSNANGANSITNGGNGIGGNSNSTLQSFLTDMNTLSSPYGELSGGNWYINGGGGAWQYQNSATPRGGLGNIGSMFASVSVPANSGGGGMANLNGMIGGADGLVLIRHA